MGVDEKELNKSVKEVDELLEQIDEDIEALAHARANAQTKDARLAKEARRVLPMLEEAFNRKIRRLSTIGIGLAAKAAKKSGGRLKDAGAKKLPSNRPPVVDRTSSSNGTRRRFTAAEYAAASREGRVLGAGN